MSEVFRIIKSRWAEVLLVVVLQVGGIMLMNQIVGDNPGSAESAEQLNNMQGGKLFFLTFSITAFMVIWQMLYLGFLATCYKFKDEPQPPARLIIIGRYFFWRMVRFQLMLIVAYMLIAQVFWGIGNTFFKDVLGANLTNVASMLALFILVKPVVLTPAIMIVKNCMVLDSLRLLKSYRLMAARDLVKLIVVCFGSVFALSLILGGMIFEGTAKVVSEVVYYLASSSLTLVVYLGGIVYVASLEPVVEEVVEAEIVEEDED